MHGWGAKVFGLVAAAILVACGSTGAPVAPTTGLAVYVDGTLLFQQTAAELAARPGDYTRGGLRGWTVFGGLVPVAERDRLARIEAVAGDGRRLVVGAADASRPGMAPVVFVDRGGVLRFTVAPTGEGGGVPHGRGPGDGRGGGNQQGASEPLTLEGVTELRLARMPAAGGGGGGSGGGGRAGNAAGRGAPTEASGPAVLALTVGGKTESLAPDAIAHELGGEEWRLRDLVGRRANRPVAKVVVLGRDGSRVEVDRATWAGPAPLGLRMNRRGLFKFESSAGDVRDVVSIDVETE